MSLLVADDVEVIGTWSADDTTVDAVEAAIGRLRREEERAAVRCAVLSLVVLSDPEDCAAVLDTVQHMAGRVPSHTLVLVAGEPTDPPAIGADVRVLALLRGDRAVSFEDVVLRVHGPAVGHLDTVVEPLTLPDLPVVAWLPRRLPELSDPLLGSADRVVVDSKALAPARAFRDLALLTSRFPVTDLSWVRLAPWRELLGGLFEGAAFRPFLDGVTGVRVVGKGGPRQLLAGWLASRLHLPARLLELEDAQHVTIEVHAEVDGRHGRFVVARRSDARMVEASAAIDGGPSHSRTLQLLDRSPARVLASALGRLGHDRVYEQALAAAVELPHGDRTLGSHR